MKFLVSVCIVMAFSVIGNADTIHVPDDYPTIQQAIDASQNEDVILVAPGTYMENIDLLNKTVTLESTHGPAQTVIDGNQAGSVVCYTPEEEAWPKLIGFTITNGNAQAGGGIHYAYIESDPIDSWLTVHDCIITKNQASYGGGILCFGYLISFITDTLITDNHAEKGGGICSAYTYLELQSCSVTSNTAWRGGGILSRGASRMEDCLITENSRDGIVCDTSSVIFNNTISENIGFGIDCILDEGCNAKIVSNKIMGNMNPDGYGGGLQIGGYGSWEVTGNWIQGNTAYKGGGICNSSSPIELALLTNNIISGNKAVEGGGVYCWGFQNTCMLNNTIVRNNAAESGGGIFVRTDVDLTNNILWENDAPEGPEIFIEGYTTLTASHCIVQGGEPAVKIEPGCTLEWGDGMIVSDPLFVHAEGADFHIYYNSPGRGSGDNTAEELPSHDFEGDPRIAYCTVDIGADEFHNHLYYTGHATPGRQVEGKIVGLPGTSPVGVFLGTDLLASPVETAWGLFYLKAPWFFAQLVPISAGGVLIVPAPIPFSPPPPYDVAVQALIGLNPDSLSNLCVLEVR